MHNNMIHLTLNINQLLSRSAHIFSVTRSTSVFAWQIESSIKHDGCH